MGKRLGLSHASVHRIETDQNETARIDDLRSLSELYALSFTVLMQDAGHLKKDEQIVRVHDGVVL